MAMTKLTFTPHPDVTAWELCQIMMTVIDGPHAVYVDDKIWEAMPANLRQHFTPEQTR